jgi:hypothetical protein
MAASAVKEDGLLHGKKPKQEPPSTAGKNYKGFVAGIFSGIAKLSGKRNLQKVSDALLTLVQLAIRKLHRQDILRIR